jgi:hypothetical protein
MTVSELIAILQALPGDKRIVTYDENGPCKIGVNDLPDRVELYQEY